MASESSTEGMQDRGSTGSPRKKQLLDLGQRFRGNTKAVVGLVIVMILVTTAIVAPIVIPEEKTTGVNVDQRFSPPSPSHPFGTDNLGRDLMSRILVGARISIYVGTLSIGIASLLGIPIGSVAGYVGGNLDEGLMRSMDVLMSFPPILFALLITAVLGPNLTNTLIALGIVYTPYFARVTRSEVISVSQKDFVEAARSTGEKEQTILFTEVLPNSVAPIIVQASVSMAYAILAAAALSFLGLGAQPPKPAWGLMINSAKQYLDQAPWMAVFPGLAIGFTVMGFNLLGDGIRDVLDPEMKTEVVTEDE